MTERGLKNINVFIQRLQTFFLFLSRFSNVFNVFCFFSGTFFLHLWLGWGVAEPRKTPPPLTVLPCRFWSLYIKLFLNECSAHIV